MTVTVEDLAKRCGTTVAADETELTRALEAAVAAVDMELEAAWRPMPSVWVDECVLRTGYSIFKAAKGNDVSGGILSGDGQSLVPGQPNDPTRKAWEIIKRYVNRV